MFPFKTILSRDIKQILLNCHSRFGKKGKLPWIKKKTQKNENRAKNVRNGVHHFTPVPLRNLPPFSMESISDFTPFTYGYIKSALKIIESVWFFLHQFLSKIHKFRLTFFFQGFLFSHFENSTSILFESRN